MRIHPTAIIEPGVVIGEGSAVWDNVHIRRDARIGVECIIGEKSYIAYGVIVGDRVKINAFVYICAGVTIETGVMIAAGTIFTNDVFPRATTPDLRELRSSDPDEHTRPTLVREGASIGAAATIGCDLTIGRFAMVGMGSTVTRSVPDFHLVVGNPARSIGIVCRCGEPLARFAAGSGPRGGEVQRFIGNQDHSSEPVKCICIHESARLDGHGFRESAVTCVRCKRAYHIEDERVCEG